MVFIATDTIAIPARRVCRKGKKRSLGGGGRVCVYGRINERQFERQIPYLFCQEKKREGKKKVILLGIPRRHLVLVVFLCPLKFTQLLCVHY